MSRDEAMKVAVKALQNTLSMEFRKTDVEIAIVTCDEPHVKFLSEDEIQVELNKVGETD